MHFSPYMIFSVPLLLFTTNFVSLLRLSSNSLWCARCLSIFILFLFPLGSFSQFLLVFHTIRLAYTSIEVTNITLLWCCSDIYLCHFMVIFPVTFTHLTCWHSAFGQVQVKDPFPLVLWWLYSDNMSFLILFLFIISSHHISLVFLTLQQKDAKREIKIATTTRYRKEQTNRQEIVAESCCYWS